MALRMTAVLRGRWRPPFTAPTQVILRAIRDAPKPPTNEELWEKVAQSERESGEKHFPAKVYMKRCLKYLKDNERIVAKPLYHDGPPSSFVYRLRKKPMIIKEDGMWDLEAGLVDPWHPTNVAKRLKEKELQDAQAEAEGASSGNKASAL
mmetsp:Transcript_4600/g.9057  ORF Transcript_4600/g.9057 Transcript_4600/m.9057 type:complete len:150 (-) Transcript_4600:29-478(-)|eukprot:CAMPEP_0173391304 /NCGR_PEP_ID=MMETSP1356-20130122/18150_1 /TAXON_ID=77927 ORGANISM="Hemiselmis virescens, Strain PCC157" /NCGR_SAMPLE_ID=MMETSP1356 /ASSEMBLY_ACC=CAM_ASM_000847 /LENGTH=149 /DNA_ID=CAMNT_0014348895 /DNA_START=82 /DNA_END=531 /DNA_ORIENTATION=+